MLLATSGTIFTRLPSDIELMVAKAEPCGLLNFDLIMSGASTCLSTSSSGSSGGSSSSSTGSNNPCSGAYAPFIIGKTDCQALQFIIKNVISGLVALPRTTTINYLYVPCYQITNGNFDNCDFGFYLDNTTNQFSAFIALPFSNFTGSSMANIIWKNAFLANANFSHTIATNSNWSGVSASEIIFCYSNLSNSIFTYSYMPLSYFNSLPNITPTILDGAQFLQATLFNTTFQNAQIRHANFFLCNMDNVNLDGADCSGTNFHNSFGTFIVSPTTNFTQAQFDHTSRIFFEIPEGESPIFKDTIMKDGSVCSGPNCIKYFKRVPSELPSVGS